MMRDGVVDPYSLTRFAIQTSVLLTRFGEVIAGSKSEIALVEEIRRVVEDIVGSNAVIESVPVRSWYEEYCFVECGHIRIRCALQPPLKGGDVEAQATVIRSEDVLSKRLEDVSNKIAIVTMPRDVDDIGLISRKLISMGVQGIVFVDRVDGLRRIVVVNEHVPLYGQTSAPQIPIVVVSRSVFPVLRNAERIRISARGVDREGIGYNVLVYGGGKEKNVLYISAHHDHWFHGYTDNIVGVGIAIALLSVLLKRVKSLDVVFASFTAEEGFPQQLSPFYWSVGSRYHVRTNAERILDNVVAVLNFDAIYRPPIKLACGGLEALAIGYMVSNDRVELDKIIFDSFSFSSLGVPTITFHSFEEILDSGIYHSTLDTHNLHVLEGIAETISMALRVIKILSERQELLHKDVCEVASRLLALRQIEAPIPLEVIKSITRALMIIERDSLLKTCGVRRVINRLLFSHYITKQFYEELNVREQSGFMPWNVGITEVPLGREYGSEDEVLEKLYSVAVSLDIVTDAYMLFSLQ